MGMGSSEVFSVDTLNLLDEQDGNIDGSIPLVFDTGETQTIDLNFGNDVDVDCYWQAQSLYGCSKFEI